MIEGLVIGHRNISEAVMNVLESISGSSENIYFLSNDGLATSELANKINTVSTNAHENGLFIFVDIYGGSCWQAAKMADFEKKHIITGFNLPVLISFLNKRDKFSFDELTEILENDAKRGIDWGRNCIIFK